MSKIRTSNKTQQIIFHIRDLSYQGVISEWEWEKTGDFEYKLELNNYKSYKSNNLTITVENKGDRYRFICWNEHEEIINVWDDSPGTSNIIRNLYYSAAYRYYNFDVEEDEILDHLHYLKKEFYDNRRSRKE